MASRISQFQGSIKRAGSPVGNLTGSKPRTLGGRAASRSMRRPLTHSGDLSLTTFFRDALRAAERRPTFRARF
jgi:hypothetical protein